MICGIPINTGFGVFGCWNKGYCAPTDVVEKEIAPVSNVIHAAMNFKVKDPSTKLDFFAILGDNYYPDKDKKDKKDKKPEEYKVIEEIEEIEGSGSSKKTFNEDNLVSGFECLKQLNPDKSSRTYVIMGNHDVKKEDFGTKANPCPITSKEIELLEEPNNLEGKCTCIQDVGDNKDTVIFLLNTNVYDEDSTKDYEDCGLIYQEYLNDKIDIRDGDINQGIIANQHADIMHCIDDTITKVANKDMNPIKNIIICGHHPIHFSRVPKDKSSIKDPTRKISTHDLDSKMSDELEEETAEKEPVDDDSNRDSGSEYMSGGTIKYFQSLSEEGINFIKEIYSYFPEAKNRYYFGADLHFYGKGTLTFDASDGIDEFTVNQYIFGTGGASLDKFETRPIQMDESSVITGSYGRVTATIDKIVSSHGFGIVTRDDDSFDVNFIQVNTNESENNVLPIITRYGYEEGRGLSIDKTKHHKKEVKKSHRKSHRKTRRKEHKKIRRKEHKKTRRKQRRKTHRKERKKTRRKEFRKIHGNVSGKGHGYRKTYGKGRGYRKTYRKRHK